MFFRFRELSCKAEAHLTDTMQRLSVALADRYAIERELGEGGMATVYLAHDVRHDRKVALKVLRPELAAILGGERFLAEIRTTANLQHLHILPLHDSGEADGTVFYVMPFVEGESLRDRLTREGQLPVEDALRIAREVAEALDYAHRHGVIHRDIKPENILLHEGRVLVADFGIALAASRSEGRTRMTGTGMSLGTPLYMAPEQAMAQRNITPRADIYALGVVLYEMLSGAPPFAAATAQAIVARTMTEEPRSLVIQRHTVPAHVDAAVRRALEKLPADRFATAGEFAEALAPGTAAPAVSAGTARRGKRRTLRPALAAAAALMLVALGVAGAALLRPARPSPVARFQLSVGGLLPVPSSTPALSPDGSRLAFTARDSNGVLRIYQRPLDHEDWLPLPGAEGTEHTPFFSPDGQWVGVSHGTRLLKVPVYGGAVGLIRDRGEGTQWSHGTWGPDGSIVFSNFRSINRISADGGEPQVVVAPVPGVGYLSPHYLPHGRAVLATRVAVADGSHEIVAITLANGTVTPLGLVGVTPYYVESGWLVYADPSGSVRAVPFDEGRLRVTGEPVVMADNVLLTNQGIYARFSVARNGTLAYYREGPESGARELVVVDRAGRATAVPVPPGRYRYPRFSPDGRRVALVQTSLMTAAGGELLVYDFAARRLIRLTRDSIDANPEWSPDGREIVFTRFRQRTASLYRVPANGSGEAEPYLELSRGILEHQPVRDGRQLVVATQGPDWDILAVSRSDTASVRPLAASELAERYPALSPDGAWLAYSAADSGVGGVFVRRMTDDTRRWQVAVGGQGPRWGPGGRELLFRRGDSVYAVTLSLGSEPRIGEPRALFGARTYGFPFDMAPDGRLVLTRDLGRPAVTLHMVMNWFAQRRPQR